MQRPDSRIQLNRWVNATTGEQGHHHVDEWIVQKAIKTAVREAGIGKARNIAHVQAFVRDALA